MDKTKAHEALSGRPIAKRVLAKMKLHWQRKVADIKNVIDGRAIADDLQKTVGRQKELAGLDPAHAAYIYAQHQVSVMSERLTALKEMAPFAEIISKAEDLYMPSAPPMSPLTRSYFTCWAFFDACAGPASETIGTTILATLASDRLRCSVLGWRAAGVMFQKTSWSRFGLAGGRNPNLSAVARLGHR
jgi:hypothetical protein